MNKNLFKDKSFLPNWLAAAVWITAFTLASRTTSSMAITESGFTKEEAASWRGKFASSSRQDVASAIAYSPYVPY